jgi:hypothetical protein
MNKVAIVLVAGGLSLLTLAGWTWNQSAEREAYEAAKGLSLEKYRSHVLLIYGTGPRDKIEKWEIQFYDPDSPTKSKAVFVEGNKAVRSLPAKSPKAGDPSISFDPLLGKVTLETALGTAAAYARENQITYDSVRVLLRRTAAGQAPNWNVEMIQDGHSKGIVVTKSEDGTLASYRKPVPKKSGLAKFGDDVEKTFLGIGGELEEFFTGDRTIDK